MGKSNQPAPPQAAPTDPDHSLDQTVDAPPSRPSSPDRGPDSSLIKTIEHPIRSVPSSPPPSAAAILDSSMGMTTDGDLRSSPAAASPHSAADENQSSGILGHVLRSAAPQDSRPNSSSPETFPVASWDRYEFLALLGQGGMGAVYKARDRRIHRLVALKFIRGGDERLTKRFMQEARAQARIDHPGICKVLEVGEVEGKAYIAMQFVDGESLQQAKLGLSQLEKLQLVREAAEALHAAHEIGIIHRDIKPAKVISVEKASRSVRRSSELTWTKWRRRPADSTPHQGRYMAPCGSGTSAVFPTETHAAASDF